MSRSIKIINYIIYLLLIFYLLVDSITGVTSRNYGISLSIPYKFFLASLMLVVVLNYKTNITIWISLFLFWFILAYYFMIINNCPEISFSVQVCIKEVILIIFYIYFRLLKKLDLQCNDNLKYVININTIIFSINMIIGLLGFGYSTYGSGFGTKGFFFAGNELFLFLLSSIYYYLKSDDKKRKFLLIIWFFTMGILLGTKTAILSLFLIILWDLYNNLRKEHKVKYFILLLFCLGVIIYFSFNLILEMELIKNIIYKFNRIKDLSGSIFNALLSGRIEFLKNTFQLWKNELSFIRIVFGGGEFFQGKNIEIDFFDSIILNGYVFTIVYLIFLIFLLFRALIKHNRLLFVINLLVIIVSFFAGHVWYNLTGGIFFVMINAIPELRYEPRENNIFKYIFLYKVKDYKYE